MEHTMQSHRQEVEAYLETAKGKAFAEAWNIRSYEDFERVLADIEGRTKSAAGEVRAVVDKDLWMTEALKRSAAVELELRASSK
jgi:hypothetical protein